MKKATSKNKGAQGCMKISSFFSKQTNTVKCHKSPTKGIIIKETINLDSDEESESLLNFKLKHRESEQKRKFDGSNTNLSPPFKKSTKHSSNELKKPFASSSQPSTSGITPNSSSEDLNISESICSVLPSTSGVTPVKKRPILSVKTPEKLFSPQALKEFDSPKQVMERMLEILTPVKENKDRNPSKISKDECDTTSLTRRHDIRTQTPNKSATKKLGNDKSSSEKTPSRNKRTPKKLFERSPSNLNEFNVEVLKNFVKITPSKKEVGDNNAEAKSAKKSLEMQLQNEKTPIKDVIPSTSYLSPVFKAKAKLDFSDCGKNLKNAENVLDNSNLNTGEKIGTSPTNNEKENFDLNNVSVDFEDENWDTQFLDLTDYALDLSECHHCKIVNLNQKANEIILTLKSTKTNEQALCSIQGFWIHTRLCIGDTVNVKANKIGENDWLVDNKNGYLVLEPDFLISTTSVVNSVFCKRRTVFQEKIRGFDPTNRFMIVGNMVHILLQEVLKRNLYENKDIVKLAHEIFNRKEWVRQIYESGESLQIIKEEFFIYIPKIQEFVETYVKKGPKQTNTKTCKKGDWQGVISQIEDIEENIWCTELGVKGKVDVSIKNGLEMIPLEVKTGRASVSLEHRGQVLLYIMMMNKIGYRVSSGLLLYLKEGILKEIPATASEKRDLIILRNELAYYLTKLPKVQKDRGGLFIEPHEIPEPIDHPCCSKCPYNTICVAHSMYSNEEISSKKTLQKVHNELGNFLTTSHIDYFMKWFMMLNIEMTERSGNKKLRDIYTLSPAVRKTIGGCLTNLKVISVAEECNGTYSHTFMEQDLNEVNQKNSNFLLSGFTENSYVVVSIANRPAVASGFVSNISLDSVTVTLDRNLNKKYKNQIFYVDSYESTAFLNYNLASLSLILDTTERANQLRSIIIDRQPPTFQAKLPKVLAEKGKPILKRLNRVQQRAVLKAIAANEYFLIKGMPGTGKTATIVALIQLLVELNRTVLITSHTHSAVDNVCLKLLKFGVKLMRLGNEAKMDIALREFSEHNLTKDCNTPEELEKVYNNAQVLAVTCLGSGHAVLSKRTLDVCIVDESTQVLQCSVFRPLFAAKTFILIGDPDQLPAVVRNRDAVELGMNESLFERLNTDESRITLDLNYRMNKPITELANSLTYNGELLIAAERIASATLKIPKIQDITTKYHHMEWLMKALDMSLDKAVQFIDTGPTWNLKNNVSWARTESFQDDSKENQCVNIYEVAVIYHVVQALLKGGVMPDQIGVIATYRVQVAQLVDLLQPTKVDINTVDQFQGKDKSVIVYSCSKSKDLNKEWIKNKFDLLEDRKRLNVAITRAKHKLIIVGDLATLKNYSTFKKIEKDLKKNVLKLKDCKDFNWENVLNI